MHSRGGVASAMAAILVSSMLCPRDLHIYHRDFSAASIGMVSDLRMEEVSLLCDEFERLQDPGRSTATEVVEVYE